MKKLSVIVLASVMSFGVVCPSFAAEELSERVKNCLTDNKNEKGATKEIVDAYCACMDGKMTAAKVEDSKISITDWERDHSTEEADCDTVAKWPKESK